MLHGIKVRHNTPKTTAIAHADDITIFITHSSERDEINETLHEYMKATGARTNEVNPVPLLRILEQNNTNNEH